ncbi:hypothetical protein [Micromonospora sp. NPDC005220]|uniref:hypothetical protein n=1 Tax=Micromonospora sp. NPDC005220 TaxID=3155589 RepID=UPI0033BAE17D
MDFLLAFLITGLAASGGWIAWGIGRGWSARRVRRERLRLAQARAAAEIRRAEVTAHLRELELADEVYRDFVSRHPER